MGELFGVRSVKGGYGVQHDHALLFVRVDLVSC